MKPTEGGQGVTPADLDRARAWLAFMPRRLVNSRLRRWGVERLANHVINIVPSGRSMWAGITREALVEALTEIVKEVKS